MNFCSSESPPPHEVVAEMLALKKKVDGGDVDSAVEVELASTGHPLAPINSYTESTVGQAMRRAGSGTGEVDGVLANGREV